MHVSWLQFIVQQAFLVHPLGAPICIAGLWFFLRSREGNAYRFLGWTYCFLLAEFLIFRGRIYYLAPIYPMLFAAGAVAIEAWIGGDGSQLDEDGGPRSARARGNGSCAPGLADSASRRRRGVCEFLGCGPRAGGKRAERKIAADVCGHDGLAATGGRPSPAYFIRLPRTIKRESRSWPKITGRPERSIILARRSACRMPSAATTIIILWGPQQYTGEVVIAVGMPIEDLKPLFGQIDLAATINNEYAIPEENNLPVYVCRQPKMTLQQAWPRLKFYG